MERDDRLCTRAAYDAVAESYTIRLPGLEAETVLDLAMLEDFARRCAAAGGRVVDVGAGTGRISARLHQLGLDVFGVDLSAGMVAAAHRLQPALPFVIAANEALPIPDASVGGALCWYSLIHTPPERLHEPLAELARVLRPGGWMLTAFQAGAGERVDGDTAYGQPVRMTNYRHDPHLVVEVLEAEGLDPHVELHRGPEGDERAPQALLLARRRR